jgi:very-short-patch-repair endonuclease
VSRGEATLALHLKAYNMEGWVQQYRPDPERKYRLDFAWVDRKLAVEVDGAVHRIKGRFKADVERHNLLQLLGWKVLRFTPADVEAGKAIDVLIALLVSKRIDLAIEIVQR